MLKGSNKQYAVLIPIIAAIIGYVVVIRPSSETPLERAQRICKDCGLFGPEIDELIEQVKESGLIPTEAEQLWIDTADPDTTELCRPCVEAVIEAAEVD